MPQLDKVTFLSQYFWLLIFFWGFYVFTLKAFIPEMSRILKFRKKRFNNESTFSLNEETNKVEQSVSSVVETLLKNEKNVFKNSQSNNDSWYSELGDKVSRNNLKSANVKYVGEIAEKSLSSNLTMLALSPNFSTSVLFKRLKKLIANMDRGSISSLSLRGIAKQSLNKDPLSATAEGLSKAFSNDESQSVKQEKGNSVETHSSKSKKDALKKDNLRPLSKSKKEKGSLADSLKKGKRIILDSAKNFSSENRISEKLSVGDGKDIVEENSKIAETKKKLSDPALKTKKDIIESSEINESKRKTPRVSKTKKDTMENIELTESKKKIPRASKSKKAVISDTENIESKKVLPRASKSKKALPSDFPEIDIKEDKKD